MGKLDQFQNALKEALKELTSPSAMKKIGAQAADMIKLRTRLGSGVSAPGEEKKPLKSLKPTTVEQRKSLRREGKLSDLTSPGKSNLTQTGQLLDSMQAIVSRQGEVTVGPKGRRKDGLTNEKVGEYVSEQGREFNNLSKTEIKRVSDAFTDEVQAIVDRKLTKA